MQKRFGNRARKASTSVTGTKSQGEEDERGVEGGKEEFEGGQGSECSKGEGEGRWKGVLGSKNHTILQSFVMLHKSMKGCDVKVYGSNFTTMEEIVMGLGLVSVTLNDHDKCLFVKHMRGYGQREREREVG